MLKIYLPIGITLLLLLPGLRAQENSLIATSAGIEKIAGGFQFVEGPAADPEGNLFFVDIPTERILKWNPETGVSTIRSESGRANGLRFDPEGNLVICEMKTRQVTSTDKNGDSRVLASHFEGKRFNSPNDLWIDPNGGIYFSDPRYGSTEDQELSGHHVYYINPDEDQILQVTNDLERPNGIIGSFESDKLYIADHGAGQTYVYSIKKDGTLTDKQLFAPQGSDGMTMDELGNLYLTGQDITIYAANGVAIESIATPEPPANVTFGGPDNMTLFITARTSVYALKMNVTGQ